MCLTPHSKKVQWYHESVLLLEKTKVSWEHHRPAARHSQPLSHHQDQSIMRTPPTCRTSLTTFITSIYQVLRENHRPASTHNLYHINLSSTQRKPPTCLNSQPLSHQSIECTYKIINLLQLTDKLYHFNLDIKRYALNQNRTHNCCGERHWK